MSPEQNPTRIRTVLAQKMRFLRFTRGWSQELLAERAGLHRTHISQIERGQVNLSIDNLEKLANAFNLPVPELLTPPKPGEPCRAFQGPRHRRAAGVLWPGSGGDGALVFEPQVTISGSAHRFR